MQKGIRCIANDIQLIQLNALIASPLIPWSIRSVRTADPNDHRSLLLESLTDHFTDDFPLGPGEAVCGEALCVWVSVTTRCSSQYSFPRIPPPIAPAKTTMTSTPMHIVHYPSADATHQYPACLQKRGARIRDELRLTFRFLNHILRRTAEACVLKC